MKPSEVLSQVKQKIADNKLKDPASAGLKLDSFKTTKDNIMLRPLMTKDFTALNVVESADPLRNALFVVLAVGPDCRYIKVGQCAVPVRAALDVLLASDGIFLCKEEDILMVSDNIESALHGAEADIVLVPSLRAAGIGN